MAILVALAVISAMAHPRMTYLDGLSVDALFWLRFQLFGQRHAGEESPTVVVAIDEETFRRPPFRGLPKVMWTPHFGTIIDRLLDSGAKVIGQDLVLPTSVETLQRGYDRSYMRALNKGARENRIVLGRVQHVKGAAEGNSETISPHRGHSFAVGRSANIRLVNLPTDPDGVVRRVPLLLDVTLHDGTAAKEPSFALELAARALGATPELRPDGAVALAGQVIPGSADDTLQLNFDGGARPVPAYSLSDLLDCAAAGNQGFFEAHFRDKIVLIGGILDVEDRKITSQRWIGQTDLSWQAERCVHQIPEELEAVAPVRSTLPGVLVWATAINNLIRNDGLEHLSPIGKWAAGLLFVVAIALLAVLVRPLLAGLALLAGVVAWAVVCAILFQGGTVLPLLEPPVAAAVALTVLLGYRFTVADRQKRFIRRVFSYYLSPELVEQLTRAANPPNLGGETRELSVLFSDVAGFTAISEGLTPEEIVVFMNNYLTEMTDIVEQHGGFVEKYIGDAIVAVFGAPIEASDHADRAVQAAIECQKRLAEVGSQLLPGSELTVAQRIGVNTGEMLIGNIGSTRRFNYTVMGDSVNLASRLEGANKAYGTGVLVSDAARKACTTPIEFREIDLLQVAGRQEAIRIFEPVEVSVAPPEDQGAFAAALALFRAREFAQARDAFAALAPRDPVAARFAARSETFAIVPPEEDWDAVNRMEKKPG